MTSTEFDILARDYDRQTRHMSFAHMMRETPAYRKLIDAGSEVVPWIIEAFAWHIIESQAVNEDTCDYFSGTGLWGMSWVLILRDITGRDPIQPKTVCGGLMQSWDVNATCKAWIADYHARHAPEVK